MVYVHKAGRQIKLKNVKELNALFDLLGKEGREILNPDLIVSDEGEVFETPEQEALGQHIAKRALDVRVDAVCFVPQKKLPSLYGSWQVLGKKDSNVFYNKSIRLLVIGER